jgi:hypothetical protein
MVPETLCVATLNVRGGIPDKINQIEHLINKKNIHFLILTETKMYNNEW